MGMPLSRRQKSWDILDQSAIAFARQHKVPAHQVNFDFGFLLLGLLYKK